MLHFNQRGWFRMSPDDAAEVVSVPIPSTAKEYYLAAIAGLVGRGLPIEAQLSKAVIPIVKKASVEFAPVDPKLFPNAPEGALMASYTFSEEEQAVLGPINANIRNGTYEVFVDGVASAALSSMDETPSFPINGFEYRHNIRRGSLEFFTSMSSSGPKGIDFFIECDVEPQPKTKEEYYLAKKAGVFIADMSWKWHDKRLTDETELTLAEFDFDASGINRWPHGTVSFTTNAERIRGFNKIIINGDQEALRLVDVDSALIPESGYVFVKSINGDRFTTDSVDVIIWHIGSTDVDEVINFVCFRSELVEDIPEPKTRSEFYDYAQAGYNAESLPEPLTRKEFYNSLLAHHTPTKKKVLFSGYGEYAIEHFKGAIAPTIVIPAPNTDEYVTVMLGNQECQYAASVSDYLGASYRYIRTETLQSDSEIWIHVSSEADAANKVVIFKTVEWTPPRPKTATEFYLAKMAGVEVVDHIEKVFEQEFTFPTEASGKSSGYDTTISNAYDETIDASHLIVRIDGNDDHSFVVDIHGGSVTIKTPYMSYAGTTHTLELFYKTVVEDVPVKTRTEQYLKAIAANQNSSDSSESGVVSKG